MYLLVSDAQLIIAGSIGGLDRTFSQRCTRVSRTEYTRVYPYADRFRQDYSCNSALCCYLASRTRVDPCASQGIPHGVRAGGSSESAPHLAKVLTSSTSTWVFFVSGVGSRRYCLPMKLLELLTCFSAFVFLVFGILCLCTYSMLSDFHRFGLDGLRIPIGVLELLGGFGLLIDMEWPALLVLSSVALTLLMLIAFGIRMRMGDRTAVSIPSFFFVLLNLYILIKALALPLFTTAAQ